jgi:hypothetical protein
MTYPDMTLGVPEFGPDGSMNGPTVMNSMVELGQTGLRRWGGYVDEEFLPQLRGRKSIQIYKEMSENDPMVGSLLWAIDKLIRGVTWRVDSASSSPEDQLAAQFVEECMDDMSHTWDDLVSEILSMLVYGWSWHEVVYKRRGGNVRNPSLRSKYDDGMIGWRKMPIRSQETLLEWEFDDDGGVQSMIQLAPPDYKKATIPIAKSLLFRTALHKSNPEGRSILRTAYRPWYFKKRIEEIEAIGIERDLAGLPMATIPAEFLSAAPGTKEWKTAEAFKKMVRSVRRDEMEGLVIPQAYDEETQNPLYSFELLSSGGARNFNTDQIIQRYEQRILMTVLADFILVGHQDTGSYALHTDKTGIFRSSLNSFAVAIANVLNRYELPRLFALNGWNLRALPEIKPSDVDAPDLTELGGFIGAMTQAGMTFFPDPELEEFIRSAAKLPQKSEETIMLQAQAEAQRVAQEAAYNAMQAAGQAGPAGGMGDAPDMAGIADEGAMQ